MARWQDQTPIERFWSHVDKSGHIPQHRPELGQCWVWTATCKNGYGRTGLFRKTLGTAEAHRVAYFLAFGLLDPKLQVDHLCRNGSGGCVNPRHLEQVPQRVNLERQFAAKTQCANNHPWTAENRIKNGRHRDGSQRWKCGICSRESLRRFKSSRSKVS